MAQDPTEFIEAEVSGGDSEESDSGASEDSGEVQATDETAEADPNGNVTSTAE